MSDPTSDDGPQPASTGPDSGPADAAARLAELLSKPLEPATRPSDAGTAHRETPIIRPQPWARPADATGRSDDAMKPPPSGFARPVEPAAASPPVALDAEPAVPEPPPHAPDEPPRHEPPRREPPDERDALARLADEMARLVDETVASDVAARRSDPDGETDEPRTEEPIEPPFEVARAHPEPVIAPTIAAPTIVAPAVAPPAPEAPPAPRSQAAAKPDDAEPPLDPAAARIVKRVRRLMLISSLTTVIGAGAVFVVIGYRIYKSADTPVVVLPPPAPAPPPMPIAPVAPSIPTETTLALPKEARIIQTAVADDRLVITLAIDGAIEIRTFDLKTLQPLGRLSFTEVP
jgi:hypothetical protein